MRFNSRKQYISAIAILLMLPFQGFSQAEAETSEFLLFFGRLHPLVLHLPIGFLILAFAFEFMSRFEKFKYLAPATKFTLGLGAASAIIAAMFGYFLSLEGGYGEDALNIHKYTGIGLTVLSILLFVVKSNFLDSVIMKKIYTYSFIVMILLLTGTGHFGANLTHGEDYVTYYLPNSVRTVAGLKPRVEKSEKEIINFDEAVIYADLIKPILEDKCVSCHNTSKTKGDLQMHTIEAMEKGGENGPIFVSGEPENSTMYKYITLPKDDEKHMPPDGKKQLRAKEIELIHWWIQSGGSFSYTVADVKVPENVNAIFTSLKEEMAKVINPAYSVKLNRVEESEIFELAEQGIRVNHIAQNTSLVQAKVTSSSTNPLGTLSSLKENITWLDLGGLDITDDMIEDISKFKNLTKLHLENTKITDKGLGFIAKLKYLEYLNLYGTQISNEGLKSLQNLEYLKNLYVWKTGVDVSGKELMESGNESLRVELGLDISTVDTIRLSPPKIVSEKTFFKETTTVTAEMRFEGVKIYYTLDGTDPTASSSLYEGPLTLDKTTTLKMFASKEGWKDSEVAELEFTQLKFLPEAISLKNKPAEKYSGGGPGTLIDSQKGTLEFTDGKWLGFDENDLVAEIDMGEKIDIKNVKIGCLEVISSYIFLPQEITIYASADGKNYEKVGSEKFNQKEGSPPPSLKQFKIPVNKSGMRFVKVEAKNMGRCPKWHPGAGDKAWLFVDEIIVE